MNNLTVTSIDYMEISQSWNQLWAEGHEPYSSMLMNSGFDHHIKDQYKWRGFAVKHRGLIVGVNAGHKSSPRDYRTRGLWVDPDYRGQGIAQLLFEKLENQAQHECCRWLWSYPRLSALGSYIKAGYEPYGTPEMGDWDHCTRARKDLSIITTTVWNIFDNPTQDQQWVEEMDNFDKKGFLLGQNEEVRGNNIHITQHWVNSLYSHPHWAVAEKNPLQTVVGDIDNPVHVL